jgi:diadenosine tetraphosphate (Ap4A) HIT family hydrolase
METATGDKTIHRDSHWVLMAMDVPGWIMVATVRHGDGPWDLTPGEASGLGDTVLRSSKAIKAVVPAERVYVLALGEMAQHFHCLVMPRLTEDNERRLDQAVHESLAALRSKLADEPEAVRTAAALREAYEKVDARM